MYGPTIHPFNGEELWTATGLPPIMPPHSRTRIGRPEKARRREKDEPPRPNKLRRQGTSIHCSNCGVYGHNMNICEKPVDPNIHPPIRKGNGKGRGKGAGSGSAAPTGAQPAPATPTGAQPSPIAAVAPIGSQQSAQSGQ